MKKMIRLSAVILLSAIAAVSSVVFCSCSMEPATDKAQILSMRIPKIGKADCILITDGNVNVVIDTGETDDAEEIKAQAASMGIGKIDYLILTHYDKDHIGSAAELISAYEVGYVIAPDYKKSSAEYNSYAAALKKKDIVPDILTAPEIYSCGSFSFCVYPPQKSYEESNDMSLCVVLTHGENTFLFAGDVTYERTKDILSEGQLEPSCDFLKVPHHGEYDSGISDFISAAAPLYAVVTCSKKNPPDDSVMVMLKEDNIETYLTSEGDIVVTSNGKQIKIIQNNR